MIPGLVRETGGHFPGNEHRSTDVPRSLAHGFDLGAAISFGEIPCGLREWTPKSLENPKFSPGNALRTLRAGFSADVFAGSDLSARRSTVSSHMTSHGEAREPSMLLVGRDAQAQPPYCARPREVQLPLMPTSLQRVHRNAVRRTAAVLSVAASARRPCSASGAATALRRALALLDRGHDHGVGGGGWERFVGHLLRPQI